MNIHNTIIFEATTNLTEFFRSNPSFHQIYSCFTAIPQFYHQDTEYTDELWLSLLNSLYNVSPYIPHIFNRRLQHIRTARHPVFSVLLKVLPQRSQYKLFVNIIQTSTRSSGFLLFLKSILFCGYTGLFYPWNNVLISPKRIFQLYEFLCVQQTSWEHFIEHNIRSLFFMIKEYVCFFIQLNPAAHHILNKHHSWITHETTIIQTMNRIRGLFNQSFINPHRHMLTLSHKLLSSSASSTFFQHHVQHTRTVIIQLIQFWSAKFEFSHKDKQSMTTVVSMCRRINQLTSDIQVSFHQICHDCKTYPTNFDDIISTVQYPYKLYLWSTLTFFMQNIHFCRLPVHHLSSQICAVAAKHDLDPTYYDSIASAASVMGCLACGEILSNGYEPSFSVIQKKAHYTAIGHCNTQYDPVYKIVYCQSCASKKRRRHSAYSLFKCGQVPCIQLGVLGSFMQFYNISYIICPCCGQLAKSDNLLNTTDGIPRPMCTACFYTESETIRRPSSFCYKCLRTSVKMTRFCVFDDVDIHNTPWSTISLCCKHSKFKASSSSRNILLKSLLTLILPH